MILLLGDIHGDVTVLKNAIRKAEEVGATCIIQVGDFGLFQRNGLDTGFHRVCQSAKIPVYFIEGNHDDCVRWTALTDVTQVWDDANLFYIPRGTVMEIDGKTIAFMGGAASIDKATRLKNGWHWDENELLSQEHIDTLFKNAEGKTVDVFITHCPPDSVISEHFDNSAKILFGVGPDWTDPTQAQIEDMWHKLGTPPIFSGHMHKRVVGMTYRILDINELLAV
jgi:Icc-related predicted phosphoesterase